MTAQYLHLGPRYEELETFDEYYNRVNCLILNFPKSVLKQWLFDHFQSVISRYAWLEFEKLLFREEMWETERVIHEIKAWNEPAVESWKTAFFKTPEFKVGPLITFMHQNGTWPEPPLILDNFNGLRMPDQSAIARWELIEGHHRLAYLRALYENPNWRTIKQHSLWIVTREERT